MPKSTYVRALPRLIWLSIGLGLFSAVAIALTIIGSRADAFDVAAREQSDLATVLGEQLAASNRAIDAILDGVTAIVTAAGPHNSVEFREASSSESVGRQLRAEIASAIKIDDVAIADSSGDIVNTSREWPAQNENISHEDDFIFLSENQNAKTYISLPVQNRRLDETLIYFGRRISSPDGQFLGMIHVGMTLKYYYSIYTAISALRDKAVFVEKRSGTPLFRFPELPSGSPLRAPKSPIWARLVAAGGGAFRTIGLDGKPRLIVVHPLDDYPLTIAVSETEDAVLALWRVRGLQIGFGAFLALLCAVLLLRATFTHLHRLLRSEALLVQKGSDMEALNARFAHLLGNIPQGVAMFAGDRRLIIANARYGEIYGLSAQDVTPGTALETILAKRAAKGMFVGTPEAYLQARVATIPSKGPVHLLDRLSNGQVILIFSRPMADGGWLTVHEDVTARQNAEDKIEHLALHDQLTGAANRALLLREMGRLLPSDETDGRRLDVVLLDLDEFKAVNDTRGHPFGDALLKAVAERLREAAGEGAIVARIGGDEFAVLNAGADEEIDAGLNWPNGCSRRFGRHSRSTAISCPSVPASESRARRGTGPKSRH